MRGIVDPHLFEEPEWVRVSEQMIAVERVEIAPLGEDSPVRVADSPLELGEVGCPERGNTRVPQRNQAGLEVLRQRPARDGVMRQPSGQVDLADRRAGPVDHRGGQHAPNTQLLAEADEQRVHSGRVHVGELGQVADAHEDRRVGISPSDFQVAAQRSGESKSDRLENGVDAIGDSPSVEVFNRPVQAVERAGRIRDRHDLGAPVRGPLAIGGVDAQHQFRAGTDGSGHLVRVEAVDRHPQSFGPERGNRLPDPGPARTRVAAQVDQVGPFVAKPSGLRRGSPRSIVGGRG